MANWTDELARSGAIGVPVAPHWAVPLRAAQAELTLALAGTDLDTITSVLMALRSSTVRRNETADEAQASLNVIVAQLKDVPLDILRRACDAYTRAPGTRFFPRASGELFAFINPLLHDRKRTAHRLGMLATEAERVAAEEAKHKGDEIPYTLDELRQILPTMRATAVRQGWATQAMVDQLDAEAAVA